MSTLDRNWSVVEVQQAPICVYHDHSSEHQLEGMGQSSVQGVRWYRLCCTGRKMLCSEKATQAAECYRGVQVEATP